MVLCLLIVGALQHKNEKPLKNPCLQHKQTENIILLSPKQPKLQGYGWFWQFASLHSDYDQKNPPDFGFFLHTCIF